jgi:hypothetical protein
MLNPNAMRLQIENIKLIYPELLQDDQAWSATLESETDFHELLTDIVRRIEDCKALASGTKDRLEELATRKQRFEHNIETFRTILFNLMQAAELTKLVLPEATLSIRAGQPQLIGDNDAEALLPEFRKVSVTPNREAIKEALKAGETVPGFSLSNATPTISIRIK